MFCDHIGLKILKTSKIGMVHFTYHIYSIPYKVVAALFYALVIIRY